ncbi:S8 family serine peptidase [Reichenbachiella sp. MALMAid0571]
MKNVSSTLNNKELIVSGKVVMKLKRKVNILSQGKQISNTIDPDNVESISGIKSIESLKFNRNTNLKTAPLSTGNSVLDNIYIIETGTEQNIEEIINNLRKYSNVVYVEPFYKEQLLFTPNDTNIGLQTNLNLIKAKEAWDITRGSESIIVGVSDTGVQLDHVDLADNLHLNEADPVNGLDDDGNGFVDDYQGWDFADLDNDPTADQNGHGTFVAGLSSAVTDNSIGMAGIGYNSKFVPLKVFSSSGGNSFDTYGSIIYAADQGYDVINLSWGSEGTYSSFAQDVINYAVLEKDMVVVSAAGNTNEELQFYPASYDYVLSVANTDMEDNKSPGATYSYKVDLTAPGFGIYSTKNGDSYASESGSSFSSPQVAGAAALVKSVFPHWNALQIMEQIRVTADDIYDVEANQNYLGQLGKGRLNVLRAVSEGTSHSIRIKDFSYSNSFGEYAFFNDTVTVSLNFHNYLNPTINATATLSSENPNVIIPDPVLTIGALGEMESSEVFEIAIMITEEAQHEERIIVRIDFLDGEYEDFEYFEFPISPANLGINNPAISFNIDRNGNIGRSNNDQQNNYGLYFNENLVSEHLGVLIGSHEDSISDNLLNDFAQFSYEQDFEALNKIKLYNQSVADIYGKSSFSDSNAGTTSLGVVVEQEVLLWDDDGNSEFAIIEYRVTNNTAKVKENLKVGFFADWDLENKLKNKSNWDLEHKLAYTHNEVSTQFMGIALISSQNAHVYSIDLLNENGNSADLSDTFSDAEKYAFLTTEKQIAGELGQGNDVAQLLTAQIGSLDAYGSQKVAFVIAGGDDLESLKNSIVKAINKYNDFLETPPIAESHQFCANQPFNLTLDNGDEFEIYDTYDMTNLLLTGNGFDFSELTKDSLLYVRNIGLDYPSDIYRVAIEVENLKRNFSISPDTLYLGDAQINQASFTDQSENAISWQWSFGNGSFSTVQNPKMIYNESGVYDVSLDVTNEMGCSGSVTNKITVAERSVEPVIEDQTICKGEVVVLSATNSSKLNVYKNLSDENPIFSGAQFTSDVILNDTVFYVTSTEEVFESHPVAVQVNVNHLNVDFVAVADTLDLNTKNQINFSDNSLGAQSFEWYVDGEQVGTEEQVNFTFTDQTFLEVKLITTNEMGCMDFFTKAVTIEVSPIPELDDITICPFDEVVLKPTVGSVFYFYDNADLSSPIYKGRSMNLGKVSSNSTYYVTRVDGFLESAPKTVVIDTYLFETEIVADPEILVLSQNSTASFSYLSEQDVVSTKWYINDVFAESVNSPRLNFEEAGDYNIQLIAIDGRGCVDTTATTYKIVDVPITGIDMNALSQIKFYPNPVNNLLKLEGSEPFKNLYLFDTTGKLAAEFLSKNNRTEAVLDLTPINNGVYFLKSSFKSNYSIHRIIVQKK